MSRRKVHFSMPVTHIEYREYESEETDDQPSSLYWAHVAADRDRFRKRIEQLSSILSKVFDTEFRQEVYKDRFENYSPPIPETLSTHKPEDTSIETVTNSSITSSSAAIITDSSLSSSQSSPTKQSVTPIIDNNKEDINASDQVAATTINITTSAAAVVANKGTDNKALNQTKSK